MTYSILQVAKTLGELSDFSHSNLELQKMSYIAEMLHLGRTGEPLILQNFEAWDRGPVARDLYQWAKMFGSGPVRNIFSRVVTIPAGTAAYEAVQDAYEMMHDKSPWEMVAITHRKGGAWDKFYRPGVKGIVIPKAAILDEYLTFAA